MIARWFRAGLTVLALASLAVKVVSMADKQMDWYDNYLKPGGRTTTASGR